MNIKVLNEKRIVLGVSGSIACYKAADLASKLTQAGAKVEVILTEAAARFVSPITFRSVTGRQVHTDMWDLGEHVEHVRLGEAADLLLIAPATAHTIAKLAHGLADNLLSVTALAARCPVVIAPAMDGGMYAHPATQANVKLLQERGAIVAGPGEGRMASGLTGLGRMLEPAELLGYARQILGRSGSLRGRQVVVTAGPTREALDPVRFLSNRSSGKQGLALAQAAMDAGAEVTLIAGPIEGQIPVGAELSRVTTAEEMLEAVLAAVAGADALFMAAAVSDYRPESFSEQKIKKTAQSGDEMTLRLARNPDILEAVKAMRGQSGFPRVTVGFAAETRDVLAYGRGKLQRKGLDLIAINDVSASDAGFNVDTNRIVLLDASGNSEVWPLLTKAEVADRLVGAAATLLDGAPTQAAAKRAADAAGREFEY
jgi:phosphopantothenoylcysteine decarboxylase/phosphopantothenate--cysteine ligase